MSLVRKISKGMSSGYSCYDRQVEELLIRFSNWSEAAFSTVL